MEAHATVFTKVRFAALPIVGFLTFLSIIFFQPYFESGSLFWSTVNWIFAATALLAVAIPRYFDRRVSSSVRLARDVIDHQFNIKLESRLFGLISRENFEYPRRARIQRRLAEVLTYLAKGQKLDEVVFFAHSQGSVIALDYVRDASRDYPELDGARLSMITFGSPIGTVYQRFFREYRGDADGSSARDRLTRWTNLYRIDDEIGGPVSWPSLTDVQNCELPPGGHMNYWTEREVVAALDFALCHPSVVGETTTGDTVAMSRRSMQFPM